MKLYESHKKIIARTSKLLFLLFIFAAVLSAIVMNDSYAEIIPSDRKVPWSPGVIGGVPTYTVDIYATEPPYNAMGDGVTDDTTAIQNAINDCAAGKALYLPKGTYKVTGELVINKGIVLRGDGPSKTKIKNYGTASDVVRISMYGLGSNINILSGYTKDSTSITVVDASTLAVDDYIVVYQDDNTLVDTFQCDYCGLLIDGHRHRMSQIVKISGKNGNTLTINRPLYYTFESQYDPEVAELTMVKGAGIEDLCLEMVYQGSPDRFIIYMLQTAESWVKNVETNKAFKAHIRLQRTYACEIRDSYVHHGQNYSGGVAYGVFFFGVNSDALVENNIFYYLRHSMVTEGGGSGIVFGYNFSDRMFGTYDPSDTNWLMADLSHHGAHGYMNLWESNIGNHIGSDYTHGSHSHNTFFRNWIDRESEREPSGKTTMHLVAVDIHAKNTYTNIVGNVFGQSDDTGSYEAEGIDCHPTDPYVYKLGYTSDGDCGADSNDPNVKNTLLRHGNHDYINDSIVWDPGISDHNLPDSYYLSSKPAFFGSMPWPCIGPDLIPMVGALPAKDPFDQIKNETETIQAIPSRRGDDGGCFIASAVYGSPMVEKVKILQDFRDNALSVNAFGRSLTESYYRISPHLANHIKQHETLKTAIRLILIPVVYGFNHVNRVFLLFFSATLPFISVLLGLLCFRASLRSRSIF